VFLEVGQDRLLIVFTSIAYGQIEHLSLAYCRLLMGALVRLLPSFEKMDYVVFDEVIERRWLHGKRDFLFVLWDFQSMHRRDVGLIFQEFPLVFFHSKLTELLEIPLVDQFAHTRPLVRVGFKKRLFGLIAFNYLYQNNLLWKGFELFR
jgi:hypothetical protein